jgi:hypothetical protein
MSNLKIGKLGNKKFPITRTSLIKKIDHQKKGRCPNACGQMDANMMMNVICVHHVGFDNTS